MRNYKLQLSVREIVYLVAALLLIFEIYLMESIPIIRYVDEAVAVLCLVKILSMAFRKGLDRNQSYLLLLLVLLLGIGLVSNYYTKLQENPEAIFTDVGNTFKVFVTYVGATLYLKPVKDKQFIVKTLANIIRVFVVVLFACMILHLTGIVQMGNDIRYGIPSFEFINFGAGQLSLMFYYIFMILIADLRYDRRKRQVKMLFMIMAAIVWASTLRTRAFLYVVMIFGAYWLLIVKGYEIKMNWKTVLLGVLFMVIFSLDQLEVYFGNDKAARYLFLNRGIYTMRKYFPFGAGFACYGTDAAVKYYAKLYIRYGFPYVWGLSPSQPLFAHDTYWPAIMAQFGFFGLVTMVLAVGQWVRDLLSRTRYDKYAYLAALFIAISHVSSSVATATFFHFVTVGIFFLLPILFDDSDPKKEIGVSYDASNRLHPHV